MTRPAALVLRRQRDLKVAHLRLVAHVVVADKTVEIEGGCRSSVGVGRKHFRHTADDAGGIDQDTFRGLHCGAFREIDDNLKFGLVVEREQFHADSLGREQGAGSNRYHTDDNEEDYRGLAGCNDRRRNLAIEAAEFAAISIMATMPFPAMRQRLPREADHEPRRQNHRDEEREQHGC